MKNDMKNDMKKLRSKSFRYGYPCGYPFFFHDTYLGAVFGPVFYFFMAFFVATIWGSFCSSSWLHLGADLQFFMANRGCSFAVFHGCFGCLTAVFHSQQGPASQRSKYGRPSSQGNLADQLGWSAGLARGVPLPDNWPGQRGRPTNALEPKSLAIYLEQLIPGRDSWKFLQNLWGSAC